MARVEVGPDGTTKNGKRVGRPQRDNSGLPCTRCGGSRDARYARCRPCRSAVRSEHRKRDGGERHRQAVREYGKRHAEKVRALARERYYKNPAPFKTRAAVWQRKNPAKVCAQQIIQNARRRSRKKANGGRGFRSHHWRSLLVAFDGMCAYCGTAPATSIDHFVPLKSGGLDDFANIAPACRRCNSRKGSLDPKDWVRAHYGEERLAFVLAKMLR